MRHFNKKLVALKRWVKKQRSGKFAQSTIITLITKPVWQHERVKAWMGAPLVAAVVAGTGLTQVPAADALKEWNVSQPLSAIPGYAADMQTDHTYILPVANLTGISQYFHGGHPGVDFRAPLGTPVVAFDNGTVTGIAEEKTGYGRNVYITDEDGKVSHYAHLGLIMVEVGEKVKAGDKVAEIGMTGWTTGPHLHFEVAQGGNKVNPIAFLSKALSGYGKSH